MRHINVLFYGEKKLNACIKNDDNYHYYRYNDMPTYSKTENENENEMKMVCTLYMDRGKKMPINWMMWPIVWIPTRWFQKWKKKKL